MERFKKAVFITTYALIFAMLLLLAMQMQRDTLEKSGVPGGDEGGQMSEIDNAWALFLVSDKSPLPESFTVETVLVSGEYAMDARCAPYLADMLEAAAADGIALNVISAYRSKEYQARLFQKSVDKLMAEGLSRVEATSETAKEIAPPGTSEHNAGVAVDIVSLDWYTTHDELYPEFDQTEEFAWLYENSYQYGFILRYPKDKSDITGIIYEPWHFRFVGIYHATRITKQGVCLEEYINP